MPLLILVYFQTDAIQQIEDSIRSVLGMQVPIRKSRVIVYSEEEKKGVGKRLTFFFCNSKTRPFRNAKTIQIFENE